MRKIIATLFSLVIFFIFQPIMQAVEVDLPLTTNKELAKTPLLAEERTLEGERDGYVFTYELLEDQPVQTQKVHLFFNHSSLLISPSALTVSVDGVAIKSVGLDNLKKEMVIPLSGPALKKGKHTVSIQFAGKLKEGICVNQNTVGNWLTLHVASYIDIQAVVNSQLNSLDQYPSHFIGSKWRKTQIIVPDDPTLPIVNAAMQVANYLTTNSAANSIEVLKESEIKQLTPSTIIVGMEEQFKQSWVKQSINNVNQAEQGLTISLQPITSKQGISTNTLVITASDEQHFDKIVTLTEAQFVKQLDGKELSIENLPFNPAKKSTNEVTFERIGIPSLTMGYGISSSEVFYYYMPYYPFQGMKATLNLRLKISEVILNEEENTAAGSELVILVNDVPHSIDLQKQKMDKNGDVLVDVPLSSAVFTNSTLLTIRITANGLNEKDECIETDKAKWVYVDQASTLTFHVNEQSVSNYTFRFFPFTDLEQEMAIVLPEQYKWSDVQAVYNAITVNNLLPHMTLYDTAEVTKQDLEQKHVIFIGGKAEHPILENEMLVVHYNGTEPDLSQHGLINVQQFAFIQNNPWDEAFSLVVFDRLDKQQPIVSMDFASSLKVLTDNATIAVTNRSGEISTNKEEVTEQNFSDNLSTQALGNYSFYAMLVLLVVIAGLILYVMKRRKRK